MKYGSVIFDMDGVLLDYRGDDFSWKYGSVSREMQKQFEIDDLSKAEIDALLGDKGEEEFQKKVSELGLSSEEVWNALAAATSRARLEKIQESGFRLFPEAENLLRELRENRVATGLISNAPEKAVKDVVEEFGLKQLLKFYRGVQSYEDFHDRKPHPDHLELAKAELKHGPFLYVGDKGSDVEAARNAGMKAVWINRDGGSIDVEPDREVANLSELSELL